MVGQRRVGVPTDQASITITQPEQDPQGSSHNITGVFSSIQHVHKPMQHDGCQACQALVAFGQRGKNPHDAAGDHVIGPVVVHDG